MIDVWNDVQQLDERQSNSKNYANKVYKNKLTKIHDILKPGATVHHFAETKDKDGKHFSDGSNAIIIDRGISVKDDNTLFNDAVHRILEVATKHGCTSIDNLIDEILTTPLYRIVEGEVVTSCVRDYYKIISNFDTLKNNEVNEEEIYMRIDEALNECKDLQEEKLLPKGKQITNSKGVSYYEKDGKYYSNTGWREKEITKDEFEKEVTKAKSELNESKYSTEDIWSIIKKYNGVYYWEDEKVIDCSGSKELKAICKELGINYDEADCVVDSPVCHKIYLSKYELNEEATYMGECYYSVGYNFHSNSHYIKLDRYEEEFDTKEEAIKYAKQLCNKLADKYHDEDVTVVILKGSNNEDEEEDYQSDSEVQRFYVNDFINHNLTESEVKTSMPNKLKGKKLIKAHEFDTQGLDIGYSFTILKYRYSNISKGTAIIILDIVMPEGTKKDDFENYYYKVKVIRPDATEQIEYHDVNTLASIVNNSVIKKGIDKSLATDVNIDKGNDKSQNDTKFESLEEDEDIDDSEKEIEQLRYLLRKEEVAPLDKAERYEMLQLMDKYGDIIELENQYKEDEYDGDYIYLFPLDEETLEDDLRAYEGAEDYGLDILGINRYEDEVNLAILGSKEALEDFGDDYLGGYELHPDYLYREEEFAGDIEPLEEKLTEEVYGDKYLGSTWNELINSIEKDGYQVDAADKQQYDRYIHLYKDNNTYVAEVTKYYEGDYELMKYNIVKAEPLKENSVNESVLELSKAVKDSYNTCLDILGNRGQYEELPTAEMVAEDIVDNYEGYENVNLSNPSDYNKWVMTVKRELIRQGLDFAEELDEDKDPEEETKTCCLCGKEYTGWGNNAWPLDDGQCCDDCNWEMVIPARLSSAYRK